MHAISMLLGACFFVLFLGFGQTTVAQVEWTEYLVDGDYGGAGGVHAADVDGDGDIDLLGSAYSAAELTWWENVDGSGTVWAEHIIATGVPGAFSIYAADVDGNGVLDVVNASGQTAGNDISWWKNIDGIGTDWDEYPVEETFSHTYSVFAADVNGNGYTDILGAASVDDDITWWSNDDGNGIIWTEHTINGNYDGARCVYVADINGDGNIDVIGAAEAADDITWWDNYDGSGMNMIEHTVAGEFDGAYAVYATDVDGDGDSDIIGAAGVADEITWWENTDGTGTNWLTHSIATDFDGAYSVHAIDVDSDGDMDVLGGGSLSGVSWFENLDGSGISWLEHTLGTGLSGNCIFGTDVNNDGVTDVLCSFYYDNDIILFLQTPHYLQLTVLTPNGGEAWLAGTTYSIEWISSSEENVVIELLNGDVVELVISDGTENDGLFEWTIPADLEPGDNYRIKCSLVGGGEEDISDATFAITALPTLTMIPHHPPIVIASDGDGFWYWVEITNPSPLPGTGQYWTEVVLPNGGTFGPLSINTVTVGPFGTYTPTDPFPQWVPAYAPAGVYQYVMNLGLHSNMIIATDSFEFEKLAGAGIVSLSESAWSVSDWQNVAWELSNAPVMIGEEIAIPSDFTVSNVYPNPFNPTTALSVALPVASELKVAVYNITGQQVAELANGSFSAGNHALTFDASGMASGLYFVRATVPGQMDQVQKVMLVR